MDQTYEPLLEERVDIAAAPARVWALVSDIRRMCEWSPQVDSTRLRGGADAVCLGVEFTNHNSHGDLRWTTHGTVVRFVEERELAFRIVENWVVWAFRLDPVPGGTRLTQRRETPQGISDFSLELTERYLGGQRVFTETMRAGMRHTLEAIRAAADRNAPLARHELGEGVQHG
jgi:uncharacterized protein YndB with AHSA1/START domain